MFNKPWVVKMVNGLRLAVACAGAARTPMCILSTERTDDDSVVCWRFASLTPTNKYDCSSLIILRQKKATINCIAPQEKKWFQQEKRNGVHLLLFLPPWEMITLEVIAWKSWNLPDKEDRISRFKPFCPHKQTPSSCE